MSLNVVGLISGGKDSLYSLAHCIQNGHKLVALANLHPLETEVSANGREDEDLNSFMYQTVGHSAIPLYAEALNLPLYRRQITGSAVQRGKDYETAKEQNGQFEQSHDGQMDETEDMYLLLHDVLQKHPDANALSAGAILSTYQRTRVESVAIRLGLVPLAYLWQYPALPPPTSRKDSLTGLLDDMSTAGCDARIIKLASGGIRANLVFANVANDACKSNLLSGLSRFYTEPGQELELRGAVLGEGGEYETLALDGPNNLWQRRIAVDLEDSFQVDGVTYAQFNDPKTVEKSKASQNEVPVPAVLDERFNTILKLLDRTHAYSDHADSTFAIELPSTTFSIPSQAVKVGNILQVPNLTAPGATAAEQFTNILNDQLQTLVIQRSQERPEWYPGNIISTTLLLDNIESFTEVNQVYSAKMWPSDRAVPPARVTIATFLPSGTHIMLSIVIDTSSSTSSTATVARDGLHVQSRSYWAPANIGPYSQAVSAPLFLSHSPSAVDNPLAKIRMIHMAGQIPLCPSSMQLLEGSFAEQATLALQHLWRVGQERKVDLWLGAGVAYLSSVVQPDNIVAERRSKSIHSCAQEAAAVWQLAHILDEKGRRLWLEHDQDSNGCGNNEEQEDVDVWHLQRNRGLPSKVTIGEHLHVLPNRDIFPAATELGLDHGASGLLSSEQEARLLQIPAFIAAEISELPRRACIEWWSTGVSGLSTDGARDGLRLCGFQKQIRPGCFMKGVAIRQSSSNSSHENIEVTEAENKDDHSSVRGTLTLFCAMLVDLDVGGAQVVPCIKDPACVLLQAFFPEAIHKPHQLCASHSFINLSTSLATQSILTDSELVRTSTVIPCKHVWTSDDIEELQEPPTLPTIRELAVAIILRLDIVLEDLSAIRLA